MNPWIGYRIKISGLTLLPLGFLDVEDINIWYKESPAKSELDGQKIVQSGITGHHRALPNDAMMTANVHKSVKIGPILMI